MATTLSYVNQTDLDSQKIRRVEEKERPPPATIDDPDLDADDIQTLKRRSLYSKVTKQPTRVIMDGLSRREVAFSTQRVTDHAIHDKPSPSTEKKSMQAYVVGGRDVLKTWQSTAAVVVFVPNTLGWTHKANRLLADEIAFSNQAIVVMPDLDSSVGSSSWQRTLDRLIAALHFSRNEYRPKTISLAGVEEGAAVAARAACDLWDIASYSLSKLPNTADEVLKASTTSNTTPSQDNDDDDVDDGKEKVSNKPSGNVGKIILGYAQRVTTQNRQDEDAYSGIVFEDEMSKPDSETEDRSNHSIDNSVESSVHTKLEMEDFQETAVVTMDGTTGTDSVDSENEIPAVVDLASAAETEVVDEETLPSATQDTGALMRELLKELSDAAAASSASSTKTRSSGGGIDSSPQEDQTRARRRALERDLELDAVERVESRHLLRAQSTLRPTELALLAPRALLCLCPVGLDSHTVATRLRPPTAFIFHSTSNER